MLLYVALATVPSCTVHTEENTYKAKSRLFVSPFEVPCSSFIHTQPSAAHLSLAAIGKEGLPSSWLLPDSRSLAEHSGGPSH